MQIMFAQNEVDAGFRLVNTILSHLPGKMVSSEDKEYVHGMVNDYRALVSATHDADMPPAQFDQLLIDFETKYIERNNAFTRAWVDTDMGLHVEYNPDFIADVADVIEDEVEFITGLIVTMVGGIMMVVSRLKGVAARIDKLIEKYENNQGS